MALPTKCIYQISNRYLKICKKNPGKVFENPKRAKTITKTPIDKIFAKNRTYVDKYTEGYVCTKFEGLILIYEVIILKNEFDTLLALN